VLALLLLDRSGPSVDDDDRAAVHLFSSMLAFAVERLFLRVRMTEFSAELRYLTASALGMIKEASDSPVALPRDLGPGIGTTLVFPAAFPAAPPSERLRELFSARERQIAEKLAAGCSNREIAEDLHLSTNTVKGHVARVLRKLGASNRAGAVSRYMELRDG
jgi:DNA-binding NarL/FixJ family response regulator